MRRKEIILAGMLFGFLSLITYPVKNVRAACRDTGREFRNVGASISWYRSDSVTVCRAGVTIGGDEFRLEFAAPLYNDQPLYNEVGRAISCEGVLQAKMANRAITLGGKIFDCDGTLFFRESHLGHDVAGFTRAANNYTDPTGGARPGTPVDFLANVITFSVGGISGIGCDAVFNIPNSQEGFITLNSFRNNVDVALAWRLRQTKIQQCNMISTAYFQSRPLHVRGSIERSVNGADIRVPYITIDNLKMD